MKNEHLQNASRKSGFMMFYVIGALALLALLGVVALTGSVVESDSSATRVREEQAMQHAEAGIQMVKHAVETGLESGQTLEETLAALSVNPPDGLDFEVVKPFKVMVPNRMFEFVCVGRSGEAEVDLVAQIRRKEIFEAGIYGNNLLTNQPNLNIYGYDSRYLPFPTPADSNSGAMIGSREMVDLGNHLSLDGVIILGSDENGEVSDCYGCSGHDTMEVGYVNPDPLGANGGQLQQTLEKVKLNNDNNSNPAISGNMFKTKPHDVVTFEAGDYYLTDVDTAPGSEVYIDNTKGPVRFFVEGEVYFAPDNGLSLNNPFGFQIYSFGTQDIRIQPNGDLSTFIYAPNADIGLWPNGDLRGAFWGSEVQFQPGGNFYVDTSLQSRILSNELEIHAKYEIRNR